jgi:hypothetical protein
LKAENLGFPTLIQSLAKCLNKCLLDLDVLR